MFQTDDTICAISTAPGVGGIAVVRVSGKDALKIADKVWRGKSLATAQSHTAHLGTIVDEMESNLDQGVATVFRTPNSYTGDDVVEFSVHGSTYIQQALVNALIHAGARLAQAGEFTQRAFACGKLDLAQAEAVADLIASESKAAHRIAINQMRGKFSNRLNELRDMLLQIISLLELELDFSEEDVEFASRQKLKDLALEVKREVQRLADSFRAGSAIKDGIPVAIIGRTNAGKSSILNALLGDDRAIVSSIHGTTRDVIEDRLRLDDYVFRIMDTAGLRRTADEIENLGIERSRKAAETAQIIIAVHDLSQPQTLNLPPADAKIIEVWNKADLCVDAKAQSGIKVSALTGEGIDAIKEALIATAKASEADNSSVLVTNARHYEALLIADESISRAIDAINANLSGELIAQDLRITIETLGSILGQITTTDILSNIFSHFCIGK